MLLHANICSIRLLLCVLSITEPLLSIICTVVCVSLTISSEGGTETKLLIQEQRKTIAGGLRLAQIGTKY